MGGVGEERIESAIDHLAAAALGGAVGYAMFKLTASMFAPLQQISAAAIAAALAYLVTNRALRRVPVERARFVVSAFDPVEFQIDELDELLLTEEVELILTDADRVRPGQSAAQDELVLDDILASLEPDSRVVQLFDPAAMPTAADLKARIDQHLREGPTSTSRSPDASDALHQALAELRRSLR